MPAATIKTANTVSISSCCRRTCPGTRRSRPPWPKTHGPQTARVVGPAGESIWTDKYGRIKVKFHWDRFGPKDDGSSCWVRVSSAWAGQGYGGVQIPRQRRSGGGLYQRRSDRPIVTGRVYNEASMPPWALPAAAADGLYEPHQGRHRRQRQRPAFRRQGRRRAGVDQAERNMDTQVKNDESHTIANDHTHLVGGNQIKRVVLNQATGVKGDASALTGKTRSDAVVNAFTLGSGESLRLVRRKRDRAAGERPNQHHRHQFQYHGERGRSDQHRRPAGPQPTRRRRAHCRTGRRPSGGNPERRRSAVPER